MNSAKEVLLNKPENGDAKCVNNKQRSKVIDNILKYDIYNMTIIFLLKAGYL
jgi:hypothetical protein